jgi:hypothetical protein
MNSAYLHLVLNHIPVIATGFGILILAYGSIRKSDDIKKVALGLLVLSAVVAIPVYLTGEPAEEIVENLAGVSESMIDQHEDAALYSLIFMEITGVLGLLNLFFFKRAFAAKFLVVTSLSSIIAAGSILWTASLGGQVRHSEIRPDAAQTTDPGKKAESGHKEDDDDH